jgi:putative ABC transport system permease protein
VSLFTALRHRLRVLLRPRSFQRDLDEEVRFHLSLDAMQQEHAAGGALSPADAGFAARRRFGNLTYLKEETRRMSGLGFLDVLRQDVRFALKSFQRTPGFSAVAVLTLAVGIGANTAIFSAVNTLLLRPLPFPEPERLMQVSLTTPANAFRPAGDGMVWSYPKYEVFRDQQRVFADAGLFTTGVQVTLRAGGEAERDEVELTGGGYLSTLGIRPTLGRGFLPEEDLHPGGPRVALLSDALWASRFNADPGVLGRAVEIDNQPYTIVGVLPPGFRGLSGRAQLWVPIASLWPDEMAPAEAWAHGFTLVARLKPGIDPHEAKEAVRLLGTRVDAAYPDHENAASHWGATARPLDATRVDPRIRRSLFVLLGAVGLVLLIACANVANLFLVRAAGRRREIAVRLAVGAGRGRLVRQLLTESVLLSVLGGAASVAIAWWGVHALSAINPSNALRAQRLDGLGTVSFESIHLDVAAFAFAAALTLLTGFVFGLIPALQATRPSLTGGLKEGGDPAPASRTLRGFSSRNVLAALEISLALVLLAGSGLMLRSLGNLLRVNPGFDSEHVLTLRLNTPDGFGRDSLPGFYDRMLERLGALPGVTGTALVDCPPLNGGCNGTEIVFRDRPPSKPGSDPAVGMHWVTPDWMQTLGVPLLRGRNLTATDRLGAQKVVLLNETAARTFWPGQEALGRPVSLGQGGFWRDTAYVVGIVGDVRFETLDADPKPDAYVSYYQSPRGRMMVFLRTTGDPLSVAGPARQVLRDLAPEVPTYDVRTLRSRTADAMSYARFSALLLALFAGVALALATLGVYGVISFAVSQRTREIGIRMALGAARGDVVRLVVGQGVALAAVGGAVGLGAALVATRVLRSLLYDVAPSDLATFVAIAILLAGAAVVASWIPARRAARVDPVTALKAD